MRARVAGLHLGCIGPTREPSVGRVRPLPVMSHRTAAPNRLARLLSGAVFALVAVACGGAPAPSSSPVTASPAATVPASSSPAPSTVEPSSPPAPEPPTPGPTSASTDAAQVELVQLVDDGAAWDGRRVRVIGSYVGTSDSQVLAEMLAESYPPQAGGATVDLLGTMPPEIAAQLESTADDPGSELVTWGTIEVIGTYRAALGAIEMEQVRVAPA
jgi:hypothetical protein